MYNNSQLGGAGLAATGVAFDAVWLFLAAFALLAAAFALNRTVPRRES